MVELSFIFPFKHLDRIVSTKKTTEHNKQDTYIKCKGCKCKYVNNNECIKPGVGYNILGEQSIHV